MEYRKSLYRNERIDIVDRARSRRCDELNERRLQSRMSLLQSRNHFLELLNPVPAVSKNDRRVAMLTKWKAEKQKAVDELKKNQKPAFKVGVLQRKVTGSPLQQLSGVYAKKNFLNPEQLSRVNKVVESSQNYQIITRAKAKAGKVQNQENVNPTSRFLQIVNNKRKPVKKAVFKVPKAVSDLVHTLKITIPETPKVLKHKTNATVKGNNSVSSSEGGGENRQRNRIQDKQTIEIIKINEGKQFFDVKDKIEEKSSVVKENKSEVDSQCILIADSSCGSKSREAEIKSPRKIPLGTLEVDEFIERKDNGFKCQILSFRKYIEDNTLKLVDSCNHWKSLIKDASNIPADVKGEILSLCGKTTLLTSDKFEQFRNLIDKCENGDALVKVEDLQGYQDWVSIEVEGLEEAFRKLEARRANNWKVEEMKPVKHRKVNVKQLPTKRTVEHQGVRSKIREHIQAARKLKDANTDISAFNKLDTWIEAKTPRKSSTLLGDVGNSEINRLVTPSRVLPLANGSHKKKRISCLEIMAATKLAKTVTPAKTVVLNDLNNRGSQLCVEATPLKSILKQTPSSNVSNHSVQFRLSKNAEFNSRVQGTNLCQKYFKPVIYEEECPDISYISMGSFCFNTQKLNQKNLTSTPKRRSPRLAGK